MAAIASEARRSRRPGHPIRFGWRLWDSAPCSARLMYAWQGWPHRLRRDDLLEDDIGCGDHAASVVTLPVRVNSRNLPCGRQAVVA